MSTATKTHSPTDTNAFASLGEALETAAERFEEGKAHATRSAKEAAGTVRRSVRVGVYNTAYWVSYGFVYGVVFLTELLPEENVLRRGLEEGADAALDAHGKLKIEEEVEEIVAPAHKSPKAPRKAAAKPRKAKASK